MPINKALVYDVGDALDALAAAQREAAAAAHKVRTLETGYRATVARCANVTAADLDFSGVACIARGIPTHVYRKRDGLCVFCGCDEDTVS